MHRENFQIFWGMEKSRGIFYRGLLEELIPVRKRGRGCKINRVSVVQNIDEVGKYSKFNERRGWGGSKLILSGRNDREK